MKYPDLRCSLEGRHQAVNAACAVATLESSVMPHLPIPEQAVRQGLEHVSWPGRLEQLQHHPVIICDGAHNPGAAECLKSHLQRIMAEQKGRRLILVIGMMQDKNLSVFLNTLAPLANVVILTKVEHPRSAAVSALRQALPAIDISVCESEAPQTALDLATRLAKENDLVCITGSLFLVGHIKSLMAGQTYEPVVG